MFRRIAFDQVEPTPSFDHLPMSVVLTTSRSSAIIQLIMLSPMMVMLAVPLMLIGAFAASETTPLGTLANQPIVALQIALGLFTWAALFIWPIKRVVARMGARREITIDGAAIKVRDKTPFLHDSWAEPLSNYIGLAHHIRASLSGNRHELVLVHADSSKTVLIAIANRMSQATIDKATGLLGLAELPASRSHRTA